MSLEQYDRIQISEFKGLFQRGLADSCPEDHSPACTNVRFNRKGEAQVRYGTELAFSVGHAVKGIFTATFDHNTEIVLTCDGAGNIRRSDTGGVLLNVTNMVDFAAINVYGFCLISPISSVPGAGNSVYIWQAANSGPDPVPIRLAAGAAPTSSFTAAETGSGNVDIGVHQFAVSFVTNTGFTTQPGPKIAGVFTAVTVTSTGGKQVILSSIPLGPAGTVARQIFTTQADQDVFFYCPGGFINDNTTTSVTVNFYDTDLAVSADSLFDLLETIPAGNFGASGGMQFYHGRVFYYGGEFCLVRASNPGFSESIDNVAGFIQLPDQFDNNIIYSSCILQDLLYLAKSFGIFSVTDNGGDPSSWAVTLVDGAVGTIGNMGTINLSQPALPQNQAALIADFGGLYLFTGTVVQPPLTWKINDLWLSMVNAGVNPLLGVTISIDPYGKQIYIFAVGPSILLVADYNDGLDPNDIKWTKYTFPWTVTAIGMIYATDAVNLAYRFRVAGGNNIYRLDPSATDDAGTPISATYATFYAAPNLGALNIFRFLRFRATGSGTLSLAAKSEDNTLTANPPPFTLAATPGRDYTREFNFMNEKCSITFSGSNFLLQRIEIFAQARFAMRPSV